MDRSKLFAIVTSITVATSLVPVTPVVFAQKVVCDPSALVQENAHLVYRYGKRSADVQNLQACLIEAGYDIPAGPTGYYGNQTKSAVQKFYSEWYGSWHGNWVGSQGISQLRSLFAKSETGGQTGGQPPAQDLNAVLLQVVALLSQGKTNEALQLLAQALGQTGGGTGGQPPAPTTSNEVKVALSSNNPAAGSLIAGAAQVPVLVFNVTNNTSQDVTVTGLTFKKVGVVSDINITNGYISEGSNILTQFSSFSNGVMTFSGNLFTVPAGQTKEITFRVDVSSGAPNGNTIAFNLTNVSLSAGTLSANLPLQGSVFTVTTVSNPSLAQINNFQYQTVASQVDAGTQGARIFSAALNVVNSPVKLMSVRFSITGSINPATDLANLDLRVDGSSVASVSTPDASGKVYLEIPNGALMGTGSHTLELYADVLGTPDREFKVEILRPYDVVAIDTQYNTNISVPTPSGSGNATPIKVRSGQVVMSLSSDSPTGNVAKGQSNVVLLKFKMRAAGEAVRIKWLPFKLEKSGGTNWATSTTEIDKHVRNVALYDDAGNQVGSTISQLSASGACGGNSALVATDSVTCSFGSPSSNINYLLPANTERTFTLRVDLQNTTDIASIKGSVLAPSVAGGDFAGNNNIEGQISFKASESQTISGSSLTVASTPFTASQNTSVGAQTYVRGKTNAKLASFSLSASYAEGIEVSSLTFNVTSSPAGLNLQNMYVTVKGSQWGYTVNTVDTNNQSYSFSGVTPFTIPAGGSVIVDVYADILQSSATGTYTSPVDLTGATAVGASSRANQTLSPSSVTGQDLTVADSGSFTSITVDPSNPPARQIVLGSNGVVLGNFRFTADNNEDIRITDMTIKIQASSSSAPATFRNLRLMDGSNVVGYGTALTGTAPNYTSTFHFTNPLIVPKNQTKVYTLVADVASYSDSPNSHNQTYKAQVDSVTAVGNDSNANVNVGSLVPTNFANSQTTLRTKLTVAAYSPLGPTSNRVRSAVDDVASLTLAVDPAYNAEFRQLILTFSGQAVSNYNVSTTSTDTPTVLVALLDSSNQTVATTTLTETGPNTGVFQGTLNLGSRVITAGTSETFKVRIDSSGFNNTANASDSLSVQIQNASDLVWREQGGSTDLSLEPSAVPQVVTVSYE